MITPQSRSVRFNDYNLLKTIRKNYLVNFIIGQRGLGKTFQAKKLALSTYLKEGMITLWIRRYHIEIQGDNQATQSIGLSFLQDLQTVYPKFKNHPFIGKTHAIFHKQNPVVKFIYLNSVNEFKSHDFSNVRYVIFDEFICYPGAYLQNEILRMEMLMDTIARLRSNIQFIFLGNNLTYTNPYFDNYQVPLKVFKNQTRWCNPQSGLLVEFVKSNIHTQKRVSSSLGKFFNLQSKNYNQFANENKPLNTDVYIQSKPFDSCNLYNFIINQRIIGVWYSNKQTSFYFSERFSKNKRYYYFFYDDRLKNVECIYLESSINFEIPLSQTEIYQLKEQFKKGKLFFTNASIEVLGKDILQRLFLIK